MTHPTDVDVLIVGAGPTGLSIACLFAKYGVKFKIIEKNKTTTDRSKALVVQARTLELFEALELADKAIGMGHPVEGLDLIVRGKICTSFDLHGQGAKLTKYPYILILEQSKTERMLFEKLESLGGKVEWGNELVDVVQHPDYVTAEVATKEKIETFRAKYLIAADGAHSSVRTFLHVPFEGGTYENRFLLADVQVHGQLSRRKISLCFSRAGFAGFFPMIDSDRFRVIGGVPDKIKEKQKDDFNVISAAIKKQAQIPLEITEPNWISTYKLHHRVMPQFKVQRCFFAGDAAHVHSPAGGQGMNVGIQDAFNLAWKLAFCLMGVAKSELLNTYHEERCPVARKLIFSTDRVFTTATKKGFFLTLWRLFIMPPMTRFLLKREGFQSWLFLVISQLGINYRRSSLTFHQVSSDSMVKAGDRFSQLPLSAKGCFIAYLVGDQIMQKKVLDLLESYLGMQIQVYTLDKHPDLHSALHTYGIHKDGLLIVRPDGYVAYCEDSLDLKSLQDYLNRYFSSKNVAQVNHLEEKEAFPFENFL